MSTTTQINQDGINVLSLFDGISCAKLALEKAGIKINKYYSSEICPHALAIQNHHYSGDTNHIQLGDVCKIDAITLSQEIDFIIFGSPCTQLSSVNSKDRSGLEGNESKLFYEALRILKDIYVFAPVRKKIYFLMENVASMYKKDKDNITKELTSIFDDTKLVMINSADIAPANRRRLYWTNIPNVGIPEPKDIKYQDIVVNGYVDKEKANVLLGSNITLTNGIFRYYKMNIGNLVYKDQEFANSTTEEKLLTYPLILKQSKYLGKSRSGFGEYDFPNGCYRLPSILECERLMTIPDGYVSNVTNVSKTNRLKAIGLAMTVDVIAGLVANLK
ncbi:DNA cytosine methyltransferase [Flavobacterium sp. N1719]|uniref:DNA cytosine methyltransferase n=1 Tax=Flavobacterium sp. N1719 TaxID=2885633 RepID=UPI0022221EB5|nr:DNA cytosine methyltransferase [Flavobacterium sp. N1719]